MRACYTIVQVEPEGFQGTSPLYKSDAANTLHLSGAEGSLRVKRCGTHVVCLLDAAFCLGTRGLAARISSFALSRLSGVFAEEFKTLDWRTARSEY